MRAWLIWHSGQKDINGHSITSASAVSMKWELSIMKAKPDLQIALGKPDLVDYAYHLDFPYNRHRVDGYATFLKSKRQQGFSPELTGSRGSAELEYRME